MQVGLSQVLRLFPYWGAGLILVCAEMAIFLKRRKSGSWKAFVGLGALVGILIVLWLVFRGDQNAHRWAQDFLNQN